MIACRPPRLRVGDYVWGDLFSGSVLLVVGTRRRPHVVDLLRCVRVAARTSALDGSTSVMQEPHFSLIAFGPVDYALIHDFDPRIGRACVPTVTMIADSDLSTSGLMSEYCVEDRPVQKGRMRMIAFRGFGASSRCDGARARRGAVPARISQQVSSLTGNDLISTFAIGFRQHSQGTVSYTHLTLPTNREV